MVIEKIIGKLKRDPGYKFKGKYTDRDILIVFFHRGIQVIRGAMKRLWLKEVHGLIFIGRNVSIRHGYLVRVGRNVIIDDYVSINALGDDGIIFGDNVSIAKDSVLFCTGVMANKGTGIKIGDHTGISPRAFLAGQGGITIGKNVIIGPEIKIFSENHNFSDRDKLIKLQGEIRQPVFIGDNCWIGGGVTVLSGVTIGEGSIVAAGSVVNKSCPPFSIIGGIPAKLIKAR